jgi:hypothetical protein
MNHDNTVKGHAKVWVPGDDRSYDTPKISNDNVIDNPLLPREGELLTSDNYVDSSEIFLNGQNLNKYYNSRDYTNNDLSKFDIIFERNKEIVKQNQDLQNIEKLNTLSQKTEQVSLYNLSIFQIIVNSKNAWFHLLDDLLDQRFEMDTFTKENRLFYIGITILLIAIILYLYTVIFYDSNSKDDNVQKIYHIYQYPNQQDIYYQQLKN